MMLAQSMARIRTLKDEKKCVRSWLKNPIRGENTTPTRLRACFSRWERKLLLSHLSKGETAPLNQMKMSEAICF